jgi:hypothetical protein
LVAWAGWHACDVPDRPTFACRAYVGTHGTQQAAFYAVLHGLAAARRRERVSEIPLGRAPRQDSNLGPAD